jgi:agmatinase
MQIIRVKLVSSADSEKGCESTPVAVLKELKEIEVTENKKIIDFSNLNLEEIHINLEDLKEADYLIFENSKEAFEKNNKTFFIGGDHSISYPILRAFNKIYGNAFVIVFDAHADCQGAEKAGNKKWLRDLIDSGFNPKKVLLISTRSLKKEELEFIEENKISIIKMDLLQENLEEICDLIMERARASSGFYVSIDVDCLDSAFVPGTESPEPGGLSSRDLIYIIKRLVLLNNFKGADINEININKDLNKTTVKLGAKILSEMI